MVPDLCITRKDSRTILTALSLNGLGETKRGAPSGFTHRCQSSASARGKASPLAILSTSSPCREAIVTFTPEGVVNVNVGDEVVCEIDGIGRLVNTLIADAPTGDTP